MSDILVDVKKRCGIADAVTVYDTEISSLIEAAIADMKLSGVGEDSSASPAGINVISCYVKAYIGSDRENTEKYISLYRDGVFRLTMMGG